MFCHIQILIILVLGDALKSNADIIKRLQFPIGGLFNSQTERGSLKAYENILKRTPTYLGGPIVPDVRDSYSTALYVCRNTTENGGIIALIDARPTFGECDTTCLLCNRLQIPHLSVGWQMPETIEEDAFTFAYHPSPEITSKAFAALIRDLHDSSGFDKFTILYEDDDSFIRVQEVINTWPYEREAIIYRKLYPDRDNRETFKFIFKVAHMSYHVLDCQLQNIKKYMSEIIQVENSTHYQSFILTNLDAYKLRFDDIPELRANVSTLHLTTDSSIVRWQDYDMVTGHTIRVETALTADAMNHLEMAIRYMLDKTEEITRDMFNAPPPLCFEDTRAAYDDIAWSTGEQLRDALLNTSIHGFTGNVEFDPETRKRTNLIMYYSKLNNQSIFENAGFWNSSTNTITTRNNIPERSTFRPSDSTIKVVTITSEPYYFKKTENGTEGEEYVGYAVDLIDAIFQDINKNNTRNYKYEMYIAPGDKYGTPVEGSKNWDGLIGEIMTHSAELGICDLTITSERNEVVDFSNPFMSLGISMLFKDPDPVPPDMFSFIKPLAIDVWLYLCTSYIIVSVILLICARMSQGDWVNPHPCNQNPENFQNIWTLYNCMWLMMGSIMTQGCDILPRAASSRWITGVWWFFAMIITATYMANMSTFLSDSRRNNFISDVKSLSEQTKISYGAVYNASTYKFFQNSEDVIYSKIWATMDSARPSVFTKDNKEGIERVIKTKGGKYAFFMESTAIDYYTQRHCELRKVGQRLDSKDYGIAVPKNSQLKELVDLAIIHLQETGRLEALKTKWWEEGIKKCENPEEDTSGSLQMMNTSGIFLVLGVGGILGLFVAVIDFIMHAFKISVKERISFREALISEWRASLDPRSLKKPAAPPRSAAPSPERDRSQSRAVSVLRAATSLVNLDNIY